MLTLTDFLDLISVRDSWQMKLLRDSIAQGAVIIAGTSYRDPDVRQWLHAALKDSPEEHAAIVLLARQGFSVDKEQFAKLERALSAIPNRQVWVNPDCGLKTRGYSEVTPSLHNLVAAARAARSSLAEAGQSDGS